MPDTSPPLVEPFSVDQSRTVERAHDIVADLNHKFSAPRYGESGRTLSVKWLTSPELKAWSGPADDGASDVIALSYGTAMALYADAYAFCRIAADHFTLPHYDYLFENFDYGEGKIVLPNGLGFEMASDLMFHLSLAWLYLHEQAHLFQEHVALAGGVPVRMATDVGKLSVIDELASHSSGKDLRGTEAAISHVIELSADAEATSLVFQLLMFLDRGQVSRGALWMLICAMACLFQRFFGTRSLASPQEALGTHPDPAFRMRMAVRELRNLVMHEKVRPRLPWLSDAADFDRVVDHATTTVSMFWTIRLQDQGREKVPDFYAGVHALDLTPVAYRDALFAAWSQLKGPVERAYRGWGTELPFDPLSSRAFS